MGFLPLFIATAFCCCQHTCWALMEQGSSASLNSSGNNVVQSLLGYNINRFSGKSKPCCPCDFYSLGNKSHTSDCTKYFECNYRRECGRIRQCPQGSRFNHETRKCETSRTQCLTADYKKSDGSCILDGNLDKNTCKDISLRCPLYTHQCNGKNSFVRRGCRKTCGRCECGIVKPVARIIGGKETVAHQYPWMATIIDQGVKPRRARCGGSVISSIWILTAAHCFSFGRGDHITIDDVIVLLGHHNLQTAYMQHKPKRLIRHSKFMGTASNTDYASFENDIALLELETPIEFSETISPVCLPPPNKIYDGIDVTAIGYGVITVITEISANIRPLDLMEVKLSTINHKRCKEMCYIYNSIDNCSDYKGITANMMCAWNPWWNKNTCKGDAGGPLVTIEKNLRNENQYVQIGIVSLDSNPCAKMGKPGVYTRVSQYIGWIDNNTDASNPYGDTAQIYNRKN